MARNSGDILGLGGVEPDRTNTDNDEIRNRESGSSDGASEIEKRRRRMEEGADELVPSSEHGRHQSGGGAAGVDMGAAGEGTDIE